MKVVLHPLVYHQRDSVHSIYVNSSSKAMVNTYLVLATVSPRILTHLLVITEGSAQLEGYIHSLNLFGIPCLKLCMCQKLQQTCKATMLDTMFTLQA